MFDITDLKPVGDACRSRRGIPPVPVLVPLHATCREPFYTGIQLDDRFTVRLISESFGALEGYGLPVVATDEAERDPVRPK